MDINYLYIEKLRKLNLNKNAEREIFQQKINNAKEKYNINYYDTLLKMVESLYPKNSFIISDQEDDNECGENNITIIGKNNSFSYYLPEVIYYIYHKTKIPFFHKRTVLTIEHMDNFIIDKLMAEKMFKLQEMDIADSFLYLKSKEESFTIGMLHILGESVKITPSAFFDVEKVNI